MERKSRNWVRACCIGRGSFGAVHLAFDGDDCRLFAVKTVASAIPSAPGASAAAASLENEIEILRLLSSPFVVSYLGDDFTNEDELGVCRNLHVEYVPGGTVAELAGKMEEREIRAYTRSMVRALHYLHAVAGVVHGDVKGQNVLIGAEPGVAKLCDFGSARLISESNGGISSSIAGTLLWMAPEVARGERQSPESDVWSLGCTVIEMVTGKQPWSGDMGSALFRIWYGEDVPELPERLSAVGRDFLDKCLRREAGQRWSCEMLLRHPFIAGEEDEVSGPSPRSVLDWGGLGFEDEEDLGEEEEGSGFDLTVVSAEKRIRDLAADGELAAWEGGDGWEVIRAVEEGRGDEGKREEYSDLEMVSQGSPDRMTCHYDSSLLTSISSSSHHSGWLFRFCTILYHFILVNTNSFLFISISI